MSVSASEDVIGDPSRPGTNSSVNYLNQDERNVRKCWESGPISVYVSRYLQINSVCTYFLFVNNMIDTRKNCCNYV